MSKIQIPPKELQATTGMALFFEAIRNLLTEGTTTALGLFKQAAARANSTATVTAADAGATYTAAEQALINEIKADHNQLLADFNDLLAKMRTAGMVAS